MVRWCERYDYNHQIPALLYTQDASRLVPVSGDGCSRYRENDNALVEYRRTRSKQTLYSSFYKTSLQRSSATISSTNLSKYPPLPTNGTNVHNESHVRVDRAQALTTFASSGTEDTPSTVSSSFSAFFTSGIFLGTQLSH
jgi:hypothetical protein